MSHSNARQNFHAECEAGINDQINLELHASYTYLSLSFYFDRDDTALPGLRDYFKKRSEEKRSHADKLMSYQNKRGGRIILKTIQKPATDGWDTAVDAMGVSLELEKKVNQSLLNLHKLSDSHGDAQMSDFIEGAFLHEQVAVIKELSDHITNLRRVGNGLGEYMFDQKL